MTDTDQIDETPTETTTEAPEAIDTVTDTATTEDATPTRTEDEDADKALATYWETGHVPAGWVYSAGSMRKRNEG